MRLTGVKARSGGRLGYVVVLAMFVGPMPAQAHHTSLRQDGQTIGVAIPAISHSEMPVIANYRAEVMNLAERQPRTDPTLRRLQGFVSLQYFACLRGLVPGSLSDEGSPFNECAHAYLAGTRALLAHMASMPGDQSAAKVLQAQIGVDLAREPGMTVICSNSNEAFDSGIVVEPDWTLAPTHLPTLLTFAGLALLSGARLWASVKKVSGRYAYRRQKNTPAFGEPAP